MFIVRSRTRFCGSASSFSVRSIYPRLSTPPQQGRLHRTCASSSYLPPSSFFSSSPCSSSTHPCHSQARRPIQTAQQGPLSQRLQRFPQRIRPFGSIAASVHSDFNPQPTPLADHFAELDDRIRIFPSPMPRSYADAVDKLNGLQTNFAVLEAVRKSGGSANKNALPEMIQFVERSGYNPEDFDDLNLIHVTGTKGKGSTCALTESILRNYEGKKIKTGLYTSPHLMEVRERIRINGEPITQELFAKYFFEVWDRLDSTGDKSKPGYFRFLTVLAFHVFKQEKVDVAILEVGVGGAYDSTNIIHKPIVCGVAALGIDHVSVLGSTLGEIAWNKGGIFKQHVPAVSSDQPEEGLTVLQSRAKELGASLQVVPAFTKQQLGDVTIGLAGKHQVANAALATALCRIWIEKVLGEKIGSSEEIIPKEFIKGLSSARWPGRGQIMVRDNKPKITWFFDGAHTAESIRVCADWFKEASYKNAQGPTKKVLVFNCTGPRDGDVLLGPLAKIQSTVHFDHAVFTPAITFASNTYKGDLVNNNAPLDLELKTQKTLAGCWVKQVELAATAESRKEKEVTTTVLPSIEHSVNWIDDFVKTECEKGTNQVQVLVTGSLHLVGGVQSVLGCEIA
ncbi:Folylpolyglutamate synthetase [Mortierella sp. GBA30]|nr:Folylpolyglutamate synthetase [Mortierella sp. GBA30]